MRTVTRVLLGIGVVGGLAGCGPHWVDLNTMDPVEPEQVPEACSYAGSCAAPWNSEDTITSEEALINGVQFDLGMMGEFLWHSGLIGGMADVGYVIGRHKIAVAGAYLTDLTEEVGRGLIWARHQWFMVPWPYSFYLSPNLGYATDGNVVMFGEVGWEPMFRWGFGFCLSLYAGIAQDQSFGRAPDAMFGLDFYFSIRTFSF